MNAWTTSRLKHACRNKIPPTVGCIFPVIGVSTCVRIIDGQQYYLSAARYGAALVGSADGVPIMLPSIGTEACKALNRIDGILLSGSPSNVEPRHYGNESSLTPGHHDQDRDATTLPLIRSAIARKMPILAICRGLQELNVAMGGTLHQELHEASKDIHYSDEVSPDQRNRKKHVVHLTGNLQALIGAAKIEVNSTHCQAVKEPAPGFVVEGRARDGTIEALRFNKKGHFVYGVQWHPEWRFFEDEASNALFAAFGRACQTYAARRTKPWTIM